MGRVEEDGGSNSRVPILGCDFVAFAFGEEHGEGRCVEEAAGVPAGQAFERFVVELEACGVSLDEASSCG